MRAHPFLPAFAFTLATLGFLEPALAADDAMTGKINNGAQEAQSPPPRLNNGLGPDNLGEAMGPKAPRIAPANPGPQGHATADGLTTQAAEAAATPAGGPPGASPQTMPSTRSAQNAADDKRSWIQRELNLSPDQKRAVVQDLAAAGAKSEGGAGTTGSNASGSTVWVGNVLPQSITLHDFPPSLTARLPELKGLQYVKLVDRILIVEPSEHVVVSEVSL